MRRLNRAIKSAKRGVSWIIFAILKNQNVYSKLILPYLLSKHWFASSVWNVCRWVADVPPRETSPAAKSEQKRMFSRATFLSSVAKDGKDRQGLKLFQVLMLCLQIAPKIYIGLCEKACHCSYFCQRSNSVIGNGKLFFRFIHQMRCNWGRIILYFMLAPEFECVIKSSHFAFYSMGISFLWPRWPKKFVVLQVWLFFKSSTIGEKVFETFVKWAANGGIFRERKQSGPHPLYKVGLFDHCYYVI